MTQRQVSHQVGFPPCAEGHEARHILDCRSASAGGGHILECACRRTAKHSSIDLALSEWFRINHKRRPRAPRSATAAIEPQGGADVLQFPLFQRSASA